MEESNVQVFQAEKILEHQQETRVSCEPGTGLEEKPERVVVVGVGL